MSFITYQIETELEYQRITSALDALNIPFTARKYGDTSFPIFGPLRAFAEISIETQYRGNLQDIVAQLPRSEPLVQSPKRRLNIGRAMWIVYTVVATLLLLKYWHLNGRSYEDKNFSYEWSVDNTHLYMKHKKTGTNAHLYVDENYNYNYEEQYSYAPNGVRTIESHDRNEDGFFEEVHAFNHEGQFTSNSLDVNGDGLFDTINIVLENGDTLRLVDENFNGFLEVMRLN